MLMCLLLVVVIGDCGLFISDSLDLGFYFFGEIERDVSHGFQAD